MHQFFAALNHIKLKNFDVEFLELMPGINISNSNAIKKRLLTDRNKSIMGFLEASHFNETEVFLYFEYDEEPTIFEEKENLEKLYNILSWVDDILKNLWLVKDNSIMCDRAYMVNDGNIVHPASLSLQYKLAASDGAINSTTFSKEELLNFREFHDQIEEHFYANNSMSTGFMQEKNFSRLNRALMFVKQAREARNLAFKISNYCSALETLFSTDSAELSHKLAERIAFFIQEKYEKLPTFKTIKKAYGIRSKFTHGDTLENKQIDILGNLSVEIDDILRFALNKILKDEKLLKIFESPKNLIDEYFESLIFKK